MLTQAAFTAGPWTSDDDGDGFITVRDAEGEFVTRLAKSRYYDDRADPECEANNALMIAAPALYEALIACSRELYLICNRKLTQKEELAVALANAALRQAQGGET